MKRFIVVVSGLLVMLAVLTCSPEKPLSEAGEKVYDVKGRIVGRDSGDNTIALDHERIPGFMEAMQMDFSVRGVKVTELPADNTRIAARLHVTQRGYWLTDIKASP